MKTVNKGAASWYFSVIAAGLLLCLLMVRPLPVFSAEENTGRLIAKIEQIAVMPAIESVSERKLKKLEETLDCQLAGLCSLEDKQPAVSEEAITRLVQTALKRELGDKVVPSGRVESVFSRLPLDEKETSRQLAIRLGKELQVDHVLVGIIWRYEERVGSPMAATSPASVAFSLYLVNVEKNTLEWQDAYDKTQSSLSDNLFDSSMFIKKGLKWLSAEELASFGVEKVLGTFPR